MTAPVVVVSMSEFQQLRNPGTPRRAADAECVWYDLAVCHYADGSIETWVKGLSEHPDSKDSMAAALRQAADALETAP